jgi:histidine ammonia-lyase
VAAAHCIACIQALRLRQRDGDILPGDLAGPLVEFVGIFSESIPFVDEDEPLDGVLLKLCEAMVAQRWALH